MSRLGKATKERRHHYCSKSEIDENGFAEEFPTSFPSIQHNEEAASPKSVMMKSLARLQTSSHKKQKKDECASLRPPFLEVQRNTFFYRHSSNSPGAHRIGGDNEMDNIIDDEECPSIVNNNNTNASGSFDEPESPHYANPDQDSSSLQHPTLYCVDRDSIWVSKQSWNFHNGEADDDQSITPIAKEVKHYMRHLPLILLLILALTCGLTIGVVIAGSFARPTKKSDAPSPAPVYLTHGGGVVLENGNTTTTILPFT